MAGVIAIGVGCRKACASESIVALVRRALDQAGHFAGARCLFTMESKRGEPNLAQAARALDLDLRFLPLDRLAQQAPHAPTRSECVERHIGLPSLAETAALAGAGPGGALIVSRIAANGATCAIAYRPEGSP